MTVSPINPFLPPPPAVGTSYGNIMDMFFNTLSDAQKQVIWSNFLTANNLTDPVAPGQEQLLFTYINQQIAANLIFVPASTNIELSPDEIKKRNIMFGVLTSVLSMLLSLQETVTVQSQNVAFYARWQKEYTNMLTRVPTMVGGESSNVSPINVNDPSPDWSKFTFGYDNISVEDIARWWANQKATGANDAFIISQLGIPGLQVSGNQLVSYIGFDPFNFGSTPYVASITVGTTFDQNVANFEAAFKTFWIARGGSGASFYTGLAQNTINSYPTAAGTIPEGTTNVGDQQTLIRSQIFSQTNTNTDPYVLASISKPYTYVAPSNITQPTDPKRALSDANAKARAEINARDQQYIENIRSKRQVVQDIQTAVQSNLDQSRQTLTQQADLFNSIIDSLKGLISSIFR